MKLTGRKLLSIGVLAFLIFCVTRIPAGVIAVFVDGSPASMSGFSGSIWHGRAEDFAADQLRFGALRWRWRPSGLLRGQLAYDVEAGGEGPTLRGRFSTGLGGTIQVANANLVMSLRHLGHLPVNSNGNLDVQIESMSISDQWPDDTSGTFVLEELVIELSEDFEFGNFSGRFQNLAHGPLTGSFTDVDGPLELEGQFVLEQSGNYQVDAVVRPRGRLSTRLADLLQYVPQEPDGSYRLGFGGQL